MRLIDLIFLCTTALTLSLLTQSRTDFHRQLLIIVVSILWTFLFYTAVKRPPNDER